VHEEHSVDLKRVLVQEFFDFLDAADGDLRCRISITDCRDNVVLSGASFVQGCAFCGKVAAFTEIAFAKVTTFAGKAARAIFEIVSVTAEMRLASDSAAFWGALVKIALGTVYRFLIWVLTVKPRLVKCGAGCASEVALAIVSKTATAVVIIETHFLDSP
jgi:hypothetical protein